MHYICVQYIYCTIYLLSLIKNTRFSFSFLFQLLSFQVTKVVYRSNHLNEQVGVKQFSIYFKTYFIVCR
jgi:hypothetical protein